MMPAGSRSAISSISTRSVAGVCSAGLITTQLPAASAGASFQSRHENWKVPGDDLTDDAQRLLIMVGDRIGINWGRRAFLRPDAARKVPEVVNRQRNIGG